MNRTYIYFVNKGLWVTSLLCIIKDICRTTFKLLKQPIHIYNKNNFIFIFIEYVSNNLFNCLLKSLILYERSNNYDWSIRAGIVDQ